MWHDTLDWFLLISFIIVFHSIFFISVYFVLFSLISFRWWCVIFVKEKTCYMALKKRSRSSLTFIWKQHASAKSFPSSLRYSWWLLKKAKTSWKTWGLASRHVDSNILNNRRCTYSMRVQSVWIMRNEKCFIEYTN
jgi:hypothetical protein